MRLLCEKRARVVTLHPPICVRDPWSLICHARLQDLEEDEAEYEGENGRDDVLAPFGGPPSPRVRVVLSRHLVVGGEREAEKVSEVGGGLSKKVLERVKRTAHRTQHTHARVVW